jgi:hypothetical protein
MLEIAITSIKCALRDDFPEFMEFYNNREWEKKNSAESSEDDREISETLRTDDQTAESCSDDVSPEAENQERE